MRRFLRTCLTNIIAMGVIIFVVGALLWFIAPSLIQWANIPSVSHPLPATGSEKELAAASDAIPQPFDPTTFDPHSVEWVTVNHVVDGDTIRIDNGLSVRYIGIDTPELDEDACFATEATERNRAIIGSERVGLRKDVSETDRYGRLLRYVYLNDGTMINAKLVQDGYATVASFPPDLLFIENFRRLENQARAANLGLWERCKS